MNTTALKELKITARGLDSLVKVAKKQLLLVRIKEAENNYSNGNFKVLKN